MESDINFEHRVCGDKFVYLPSGTAKPRATAKPPRSSARRSGAGKPQHGVGAVGRGPPTGSKQETIIGLLRRPEGATISELTKATAGRVTPCGVSYPAP